MPWNPKDHPHFSKPKNDDGYLAVVSRIIFSTGLNWNVVNKKWPDIQKAFGDFSVQEVSKFGESAVEELLADEKMIRSEGKINAIIANAKTILEVKKKFGSMQTYIASLKKTRDRRSFKRS